MIHVSKALLVSAFVQEALYTAGQHLTQLCEANS